MFNIFYKKYLDSLVKDYKYRSLRTNHGEDIIDFSTNDYLNLSKEQDLIQNAIKIGKEFGVGSTGSRLLSGNKEIFEDFEKRIAFDKNMESALIFNSGFQANFSVISALLNKSVIGGAIVFCDRLNHASIYQAILISGAKLIRYKHNDMNDLSDLLNKYKDDKRMKFIITETIFGMDGDIVHLKEISDIADKYNSFLYLDEAHATGIIGKNGYGLSTIIKSHDNLLIMGTFSKAIGVSGGYIACSNLIKDYLVNCSTGFIYSTAISPMVIGAAMAGWKMIKQMDDIRNRIFILANYLRSKLKSMGLNTGTSNTHIIPLILNSEKLVIDLKQYLLKKKILTSSVRPPTVPPNSSRIRIAINATHTKNDIDQLTDAIKLFR